MKTASSQLSVVLAVFNEEKNLARCLTAVKDLASEIIVVDGGSHDDTVKIALKFKARIVTTNNKLNFHINKQRAIDLATCPYVLQLDADEVVDQKLKLFFTLLLEGKHKTPAVAWKIRRKNLFLGKWLTKGGQYPDPVIRLFKNGQAHLPQKSVHEQLVAEGQVDWAEGHLIHYSSPDWSSYWRKFQTYTDFTCMQLIEKDKKPQLGSFLQYCLIKPIQTTFLLAIRHKGFLDCWQGLLFAFMSGLHYPVAYYKFIKKTL